MDVLPHDFESDVLNWIEKLRMPNTAPAYRYTADSGETPFANCFALFVRHLFGRIDDIETERKERWIESIQNMQNPESGIFEDAKSIHFDRERAQYQFTSFCLSALDILGVKPKFPLYFIKHYRQPGRVEEYLRHTNCHIGAGGSGNKAMFLAIFLTSVFLKTGDQRYLDALNEWHRFHDDHVNRYGVWSDAQNSCSYENIQNGFHQLVIYIYWDWPISNHKKLVDSILAHQDSDGFFAPFPGGGPCWDYDSIHILAHCLRKYGYRSEDIRWALKKAETALFTTQNDDAGFCRSKKWPPCVEKNHWIYLFKPSLLRFIFDGKDFTKWLFRFKRISYDIIKKRQKYSSAWVDHSHCFSQSDIFSTWFRCLSIAEINAVLNRDRPNAQTRFKFHTFPGIGFVRI